MIAIPQDVIVTHWLDDFRDSFASSYRTTVRRIVLKIARIVRVSNEKQFANEAVGDESREVIA